MVNYHGIMRFGVKYGVWVPKLLAIHPEKKKPMTIASELKLYSFCIVEYKSLRNGIEKGDIIINQTVVLTILFGLNFIYLYMYIYRNMNIYTYTG